MVDVAVDVVVEVRTSSPKTAISLPEDAKKKREKLTIQWHRGTKGDPQLPISTGTK